MDHPFHIPGFFHQVLYDGFIVFVLTNQAPESSECVLKYPGDHRKTFLIGPGQASCLIKESFDSLPPHRWDKLLDKGSVDLVMPLQLGISQHGDDKIDPLQEFIDISVICYGAFL